MVEKERMLSGSFGWPLPAPARAARAVESTPPVQLALEDSRNTPGLREVRSTSWLTARESASSPASSSSADMAAEAGWPHGRRNFARAGDEGIWYLPVRAELLAKTRPASRGVAEWTPLHAGGNSAGLRNPAALSVVCCGRSCRRKGGLRRSRPANRRSVVRPVRARRPGFPSHRRPSRAKRLSARGPSTAGRSPGTRRTTNDARVLAVPPGRALARRATCWHHGDKMTFE